MTSNATLSTISSLIKSMRTRKASKYDFIVHVDSNGFKAPDGKMHYYCGVPNEPDGSICGVTAYADTEYKITELGITRTLALKRNQVILDESFIRSGNVQRLCAKRRFTLAHECAHQILFQLESEEVKASCEMRYSARTAYTPRELKTREDWNEWQANVLGAAILLPQKEVDLAMRRFAETPLINYEGRYSYGDHLTLRLFCRLFGVSKTTASIRLRQLGYMVDRPFSEYVDPLEVW